jgi:hypothetical protein
MVSLTFKQLQATQKGQELRVQSGHGSIDAQVYNLTVTKVRKRLPGGQRTIYGKIREIPRAVGIIVVKMNNMLLTINRQTGPASSVPVFSVHKVEDMENVGEVMIKDEYEEIYSSPPVAIIEPEVTCGQNPEKCGYDHALKKCIQPDAFNEFQTANWFKSWTALEARAEFDKKPPSQQQVCRWTRNRLADRLGDMKLLFLDKNICELVDSDMWHGISSLNTHILRKITLLMISRLLDNERIDEHFDPDTLTTLKLNATMAIVDKVYFGDTFFSALQHRLGPNSKLTLRVYDKETDMSSALTQATPRIGAVTSNNAGVDIWVNKARWRGNLPKHSPNKKWHRRTSGMNSMNKLDDLVITLSHELIHVMMLISCPERMKKRGGHGTTFLRLWHLLFGGSLNQYWYTDHPDSGDVSDETQLMAFSRRPILRPPDYYHR